MYISQSSLPPLAARGRHSGSGSTANSQHKATVTFGLLLTAVNKLGKVHKHTHLQSVTRP